MVWNDPGHSPAFLLWFLADIYRSLKNFPQAQGLPQCGLVCRTGFLAHWEHEVNYQGGEMGLKDRERSLGPGRRLPSPGSGTTEFPVTITVILPVAEMPAYQGRVGSLLTRPLLPLPRGSVRPGGNDRV